MTRATSLIVALASTGLLVGRLGSPAAAPPRAAAVASPGAPDQTPAALADVNAEVARLRDRLTDVPEPPPPSRDPFSFGRAPEPARTVEPAAEPTPLESAMALASTLPTLVAILSSADSSGAVTHRAVMASGEDVAVTSAGDDVGSFRVDTVTASGVVLIDRASSARFTVSLH